MSGDVTGSSFANEGLRTASINLSAKDAIVWTANTVPQSQTNSDADGLIVESETARGDRESMKPIATVQRSSRWEAGLLFASDKTSLR